MLIWLICPLTIGCPASFVTSSPIEGYSAVRHDQQCLGVLNATCWWSGELKWLAHTAMHLIHNFIKKNNVTEPGWDTPNEACQQMPTHTPPDNCERIVRINWFFLDVLLVVAVTLPENIYTDFILNLVLIRSCQCAVALHHQWYNWSHCELLIELFCNWAILPLFVLAVAHGANQLRQNMDYFLLNTKLQLNV